MNTITKRAAAKYLGIATSTLRKAICEQRLNWPVVNLEDLKLIPAKVRGHRDVLLYIGDKKRCSKCGRYKVLSEYYRQNNTVHSACKSCTLPGLLKYKTKEARVWVNVIKNINDKGCWSWKNSSRAAHQLVTSYRGKSIRVRHLLYQLSRGSIDSNMFLLSICNNNQCVNPYHMTLADKYAMKIKLASNALFEDIRTSGENNHRSKLTEDEVREIRLMIKNHTYAQIAKKYNIGIATISHIIHRRTWKHVE